MIKVALSNVPVYYISLFKIPLKVNLAFEKCQRDFLWEGGREKNAHLVNWRDVYRSKEYGGLGVDQFKEKNLALPGK